MDKLWKNAVRRYTRCLITKDTDKLVAIWSVAKLVRDALQEEYGAGMWSDKLEEQLAWKVIGCRQVNGQPSIRKSANGAPSWSWASMTGMIEPRDRIRGSGSYERVYRVTDHVGNPIHFQLQRAIPKSKSDSRILTHRLKMEAGNHMQISNSQLNNIGSPSDTTHTTKRPSLQDSDKPPELVDPRIAVRGYLHPARIVEVTATAKYQIIPNSIDPWQLEHDRDVIFPEAFPDTLLDCSQGGYDCCTVVLAYSRSSGGENSFSGIGLLLATDDEDVYTRVGTFHFNEINVTVLEHFTNVESVQSEVKGTSQSDAMKECQPTRFWLI